MTSPALTILVPLRGRHLHTLRFLWHLDRSAIGYRIILADGQVHPTIARLLEEPATFPNLSLDYVRYPNDASFRDFYSKMLDSVGRVETPYVVIADNDDFLAPAGLAHCVDFLDENADYQCCGGGIAGFELYASARTPLAHLTGPFSRMTYRYDSDGSRRDISAASTGDRVLAGFRNTWSYYAVTRTRTLQAVWREIRDLDISDLQLHERFSAMRMMTLGKARSDASVVSYIRQYQTSMQLSFSNDWVAHLLRSRFTDDISIIVGRISDLVAAADGTDAKEFGERLRDALAERWLRPFIRYNYGGRSAVIDLKHFIHNRNPELVSRLRRLRFVVNRESDRLCGQLRRDGASDAYIATFRRELAVIDSVVTGKDFPEFLRRVAGDLLAKAA
jgi:glycosyltransferase domain-containing protein